MTALVRRFIKTAVLFLVIGLLLGAYMLVQRELFGVWPQPYAVSAHKHAVFVGFVMFMILGVALWLFPKPLPDDRRYRPALIETVYWLLLAGTLSRFIGELARAHSNTPSLAWLVLLGGLAQVVSLLLYVWTMWNRIRPSAQQLRSGRVDAAERK
jgi:heme/copper-type cytochrome/quinol oxidase subunit 1